MYSSHLAVCNLVQPVLFFIKSPNADSSVGMGASQQAAKMNPPKQAAAVQAMLLGSLDCARLTHGPRLCVLCTLTFPQGFKANASNQPCGLAVKGTFAKGAPWEIEQLHPAPTFGCPGVSWVTREHPSESRCQHCALPLHRPKLIGTSSG